VVISKNNNLKIVSHFTTQQELSYRKQIARKLRTQYFEGIYMLKNCTVHWIDYTRLTVSRVIWR